MIAQIENGWKIFFTVSKFMIISLYKKCQKNVRMSEMIKNEQKVTKTLEMQN